MHGDIWVPVIELSEMYAEGCNTCSFFLMQISSLAKWKQDMKTKDSSPNNGGQEETDKENISSILESSEEAPTGSATTNIQVCPVSLPFNT